jgi:integrase/recombinase XerD
MGGAESWEASPVETAVFHGGQLKRIIEAAPRQYRVLFAVLAGTGMRIGEAEGLYVEDVDTQHQVVHVRRGIWKGQDLAPRMRSGRSTSMRPSPRCCGSSSVSGRPIGSSRAGRQRPSPTATSVSACSTRYSNVWGFPKRGCAFRHSRVTQLRQAGTPQDLQQQWIGHSSLRTGDRYSNTHEELEYRRSAAGNVGLDRVLSPKQSQREAPTCQSGLLLKPSV